MRFTGSGKVVGGAVINRGADDGQPQTDVDSVMKMDELDRNQSLVMIHRNHRLEFPFISPTEKRVGRKRTGNLVRAFPEIAGSQVGSARTSSLPNRPCSPAWGLSPATPRRTDSRPKSRPRASAVMAIVRQINSAFKDPGNFRERLMDGDQGYSQPRSGKHHHHFPAWVSCWRNSVCPGKEKPCSCKFAL